ncbi:SdiA-regulated domain-containing protein [Mucilaginibacter auburnensis]|uniref:SdiA-regulated protein n=1 Tax=Mucilaginibacter auburnensis TaxID=1457233 RepID=A0A2H9VR94_9SPHI|nr:SdiA-regulated domain-containing protein [Mucilaginibacter auburnensis]PJJ83318.1 SdiA-regulated protein [Mucilaginibacter auburnensis]
MKNRSIYWWCVLGLMLVFSGMACIEKPAVKNPPGYDLTKPVRYNMPDGLLEISGIALYHGRADSIYAEQDEDGRIYYLKPGDGKVAHSKFAGHGDYEDIAIMGELLYILRSDGVIFTFPFKQVQSGNIANVKELKGLLPAGEYEGMCVDEKSKQLYVLCKSCKGNNEKKVGAGYIFNALPGNGLKASGNFTINVKDIEAQLGKNKMTFRPSALAKNTKTNEWYILSSVNKALVITDVNWQVKAAYPLNPSLFIQPEGMAFDNQNSLYISNEGDKLTPGTILKFIYKK